METIGSWELLIIIAVLVALFGPSRLPAIGRSLGEGLREFRAGLGQASSLHGADPSRGAPEQGDSTPPSGQASPSP
ncbi:MAG TPA: twin-arginine translocase TatA/TatE family subunit [Actinomycetota bacterium]|jgi:sec-independent protein translocase protein TatA|nr:twin-arginine translocase TatA/TatE family subunit [Actinomycetota bacterium]